MTTQPQDEFDKMKSEMSTLEVIQYLLFLGFAVGTMIMGFHTDASILLVGGVIYIKLCNITVLLKQREKKS